MLTVCLAYLTKSNQFQFRSSNTNHIQENSMFSSRRQAGIFIHENTTIHVYFIPMSTSFSSTQLYMPHKAQSFILRSLAVITCLKPLFWFSKTFFFQFIRVKRDTNSCAENDCFCSLFQIMSRLHCSLCTL